MLKEEGLCNIIVNSSTAMIYLADLETYEIYFLNDTILNLLGNPSEKEWKGKKCYKLLQLQDSPCKFCTNKLMTDGEIYNWTHYNSHSKKYYSILNKIVTIENGRKVHLEIAHDITNTYNVLSQEQILSTCIEMLHSDEQPENAVHKLLENLTRYYSGDRAYIFKYSEDKKFISNTYEYCQPGVIPQIQELQNIPAKLIELWKNRFAQEGGEVCIGSLNKKDEEALTYYSEKQKIIYKNRNIQSLISVPLSDKQGEVVGFIGVDNSKENSNLTGLMYSVGFFIADFLDKTEFFNKELDKFTFRDPLTGVKNRFSYSQKLEELAVYCPRSIGIVYIDINGLKSINADKGYKHGDAIIKSLVRILKRHFQDSVYRIDGDEFLILRENISYDNFELLIDKFKESIDENSYFAISMGSVWTEECEDIPQQIQRANSMLIVDKQEYYKAKELNIKYQSMLLTTLQAEIEENAFCVYLQPQVDLQTRDVVSAETLIRKLDPDGNIIAPAYFIPLYEKFGIVNQIDFFVFKTICRTLQKWQQECKNDTMQISVNFSRHSLTHPVIGEHLCGICEEFNVSPARIIIEITETIEHTDKEQQIEIIEEFSRRGFSVSLDDFGAGYSNLSILAEAKFDEVKLDKSLIDTIANSEKTQSIIKSILTVCDELKIPSSIAEGIETEEQYAIIKSMNCDKGQGYLFGRPMPINEFEEKYINK